MSVLQHQRLDWDSNFFGKVICHIHPEAPVSATALTDMSLGLKAEGIALAYVFLDPNDRQTKESLTALGGILYDKKVTFSKVLSKQNDPIIPEPFVIDYNGPATKELLDLTLLAGHDSRFKKDVKLAEKYEEMYTLWLKNSLNRMLADKVFVYSREDQIIGFVTCSVKNGEGKIGLIATDPSFQGKGVGLALIRKVEEYYYSQQATSSIVVTQETNTQAMRFYQKAGFQVSKTEHIYHWWIK